jgi:hypothetical protein
MASLAWLALILTAVLSLVSKSTALPVQVRQKTPLDENVKVVIYMTSPSSADGDDEVEDQLFQEQTETIDKILQSFFPAFIGPSQIPLKDPVKDVKTTEVHVNTKCDPVKDPDCKSRFERVEEVTIGSMMESMQKTAEALFQSLFPPVIRMQEEEDTEVNSTSTSNDNAHVKETLRNATNVSSEVKLTSNVTTTETATGTKHTKDNTKENTEVQEHANAGKEVEEIIVPDDDPSEEEDDSMPDDLALQEVMKLIRKNDRLQANEQKD